MTDGIMLLRSLIKSEIEKENPGVTVSESTLLKLIRLYWRNLSVDDRELLQNKAQRNFYCSLSNTTSNNSEKIPLETHILSSNTQDMKTSFQQTKKIPILDNPRKSSTKNQIGKKIIAAQLSKQFTSIPLSDSHIRLHHSSPTALENLQQLNENYSIRSEKLRKYSELESEEEIKNTMKYYRRMTHNEDHMDSSDTTTNQQTKKRISR